MLDHSVGTIYYGFDVIYHRFYMTYHVPLDDLFH